jgi:hypothetical protein
LASPTTLAVKIANGRGIDQSALAIVSAAGLRLFNNSRLLIGRTMKFAAIADVHGNSVALEAVLADIATIGITEVVNLGDHVSGPLEARQKADLLIERGFPSIRGDQDRRLVKLDRTGPSNCADYKQSDRKHLDWLASLPPPPSWARSRETRCRAPADSGSP